MPASTTALERILSRAHSTGLKLDKERMAKVYQVVRDAYGKKDHWSGETLLEHAIGTLEVLLPFQPDEDAIIACVLHHSLGEGGYTLTELERDFGPKVRELVSGAHLLSHVTLRGRRTSIEDLRLMLLTVSDDVRTILISLCDRCHLLDRITFLSKEDATRIARDALDLFAPVAARLGIYSIKHRLEASAFPLLYPNDAEQVGVQMQQLHGEHRDFLPAFEHELTLALRKEGLTPHSTIARKKQPYSIFAKMRQKGISNAQEIYDFYACRVVVQTVEECYQALGILHQLGTPIPHRFKDYISFPKPNGYQSLHTTIARLPGVPENSMVEIQIRTEEMHREAKYGIAAHWSYKSYGSTARAVEHAQLKRMLVTQEVVDNEDEETPHLANHIFVLTPRGEIIELPDSATPLDFAFQVHSDLGLAFRGAKVNGTMVSMDYELENGDVVEILRYRNPKPSPQWLQILRISSAKAKLKKYLYEQDRPELIALGRQSVNALLRKHRLKPMDQDMSILRKCDGKILTLHDREDLLMKIGQGSERTSSLLDRLDELSDLVTSRAKDIAATPRVSRRSADVVLEGDIPMPTRFAQCCKPDANKDKKIVGVVNRTGFVLIHRATCGMLKNMNEERKVGVRWKTA